MGSQRRMRFLAARPLNRRSRLATLHMRKPIIARRLSLLMVLLALLAGAWIEVEAAPLARAARPSEAALSNLSIFPEDIDLSAVERVSAALAVVAVDFDADGDLDIVGIDASLTLLVWENDGSGSLTLKEPSESPKLVSDAADPSLDSPVITEISDQGDSTSVRLVRRTDPVSPARARGVCGDSPVPLRTRTRSSSTPRAPPVSIPTL
jgi:hypothetical protein